MGEDNQPTAQVMPTVYTAKNGKSSDEMDLPSYLQSREHRQRRNRKKGKVGKREMQFYFSFSPFPLFPIKRTSPPANRSPPPNNGGMAKTSD